MEDSPSDPYGCLKGMEVSISEAVLGFLLIWVFSIWLLLSVSCPQEAEGVSASAKAKAGILGPARMLVDVGQVIDGAQAT